MQFAHPDQKDIVASDRNLEALPLYEDAMRLGPQTNPPGDPQMSSIHTHLVWTRSKTRGSQKLVLLALADHADRNGEASLSQRDLSALCGLAKTSVLEHIQSLIGLGELRKRDGATGRGNPCTYWITLLGKTDQKPRSEPTKSGDLAPTKKPVRTESQEKVEVSALYPAAEAPNALPVPETPLVQPQPTEWPTPKPQPQASAPAGPIGGGSSQGDVNRLLDAAKIMPPDDQPFYWCRREHREDLDRLKADTGMTLQGICAAVQDAMSDGRKLECHARRLTDLKALLGRRGRA